MTIGVGTHCPQVSVLMPVYNAEQYLSEAVESILAQSFTDFEFLIFDDGSTDRSYEILERYALRDERIRLFAKPHCGYVTWLNEGIQLARGVYIARMDADDISLPQRLVRQVEYLRREGACVVVGCGTIQIDSDGDRLNEVLHDIDHKAIVTDLLNGGLGVISHPACMIRRSTLLAIGGYKKEFETIEDFDLWFRLAEHGLLANLPEVLLKYRVHHSNVIFTHIDQQRRVADRILSEARSRRGLAPLNNSIWNFSPSSRVWKHQWWAWLAAGDGNYRTALKHARIAIYEAPLSPQSWLALCISVVPRQLRRGVKQALSFTGLSANPSKS
jgi:glycosyltransferase involved in cell wall biosynthesis